MGNAHRNQK